MGSVGIGIPGTLSPFTGRVKNANSVGSTAKPLDRDRCRRCWRRELRIANDANCLAVSKLTRRRRPLALKTVFWSVIGTGCGAGVALSGSGHSGGNGIAGE